MRAKYTIYHLSEKLQADLIAGWSKVGPEELSGIADKYFALANKLERGYMSTGKLEEKKTWSDKAKLALNERLERYGY